MIPWQSSWLDWSGGCQLLIACLMTSHTWLIGIQIGRVCKPAYNLKTLWFLDRQRQGDFAVQAGPGIDQLFVVTHAQPSQSRPITLLLWHHFQYLALSHTKLCWWLLMIFQQRFIEKHSIFFYPCLWVQVVFPFSILL